MNYSKRCQAASFQVKFQTHTYKKNLCSMHKVAKYRNLNQLTYRNWYKEASVALESNNSQQSAPRWTSSDPAEPAMPTSPCTAPGIVKGAALSLRANHTLSAQNGSCTAT